MRIPASCVDTICASSQRARRRVSWLDALLVLAVLGVLLVWWRMGMQPAQPAEEAAAVEMILPTNVPVLQATETPTPAPTPTPEPTPVATESTFTTHTVAPGETLLGIAGIYGVTVEEIQQANNMSNVLIRPDEELTIPVRAEQGAAGTGPTGPTTSFSYTVDSGDTIISIATLFGSTVQEILTGQWPQRRRCHSAGRRADCPRACGARRGDGGDRREEDAPAIVQEAAPASSDEGIYIEPRLVGPPNRATLPSMNPSCCAGSALTCWRQTSGMCSWSIRRTARPRSCQACGPKPPAIDWRRIWRRRQGNRPPIRGRSR